MLFTSSESTLLPDQSFHWAGMKKSRVISLRCAARPQAWTPVGNDRQRNKYFSQSTIHEMLTLFNVIYLCCICLQWRIYSALYSILRKHPNPPPQISNRTLISLMMIYLLTTRIRSMDWLYATISEESKNRWTSCTRAPANHKKLGRSVHACGVQTGSL